MPKSKSMDGNCFLKKNWKKQKKDILLYPEFAEKQWNEDGNFTSI